MSRLEQKEAQRQRVGRREVREVCLEGDGIIQLPNGNLLRWKSVSR